MAVGGWSRRARLAGGEGERDEGRVVRVISGILPSLEVVAMNRLEMRRRGLVEGII
jgi:hypothetical protein